VSNQITNYSAINSTIIYGYNETYNISVSKENFQTQSKLLNFSYVNNSYTFVVFDARAITFNFYDSVTNAIINNVTLNLYGNILFNVYNESTTTGTIYTKLLVGDTYTCTADTTLSDYQTSVFEISISPNSYQTKNVYLVNSTTQITYTTLDNNNNLLKDATIKVLRYIGGSWNYIQECKTNDLGTCNLYLNALDIYRYEVYYNDEVVFTTGNELVNYVTRVFTISISESTFQDFNLYNLISQNYALSYHGIGNLYNFSLTASISDSEISQVCMKLFKGNVSKITNNFDSCITYSNQNQIYENNIMLDNATYYVQVYATIGGNDYILETKTIDLSNEYDIFGQTGIFLTLLIIIGLSLMGIPSPSRILAFGMIGLTISSLIGFIPLTWYALLGLWIVIIAIIIKLES
jgi:hypothetical protein